MNDFYRTVIAADKNRNNRAVAAGYISFVTQALPDGFL
jgi:hypothetical protein